MSESVRRRKYRYDRVLIETDRILNPQFDDAVVYLTGAQIEMLRNVTQYLNRLDTYVTEYNPGYYIAPTAEDYDSILEIVADMEETLMGNPNTLWGYKERWIERADEVASGAADVWVVFGPVPEGEVWVLENAYATHDAVATKELKMYVAGDGEYFYFVRYPSASPDIEHRWQGSLVLSYQDTLACWVVSPGDGKTVHFAVMGYKMDVP